MSRSKSRQSSRRVGKRGCSPTLAERFEKAGLSLDHLLPRRGKGNTYQGYIKALRRNDKLHWKVAAHLGHRQRPLEFQRGLGPAGGASCRRRPRRRLWRSSDTIGQRSQGHLHANRLQTLAQLAADQDDRAAGLAKNHDGERVGNQAGTGVSWYFHRGIVHGVA